MRTTVAAAAIAAVFLASGAEAQTGRSVTGVGQTKPPNRSAAPPATSAPLDPAPGGGTDDAGKRDSGKSDPGKSDEQRQAELVDAIRRGVEAQRARDRATDALFARWEFAVCIGCGPSLKPFRRVWTNPLRVLAGIPASDDDKRQGRLGARWAALVMR